MSRLLLALAAALVIICSPGQAGATDVKGGSGGSAFPPLRCPANTFMLGVALRSGAWVDAIRANCLAFDSSKGQFVGPPQFTAFAGGNGGQLQQNGCPPDRYVSAIKIGFTRDENRPKYLDYVELTCTVLSGYGGDTKVCLHTGNQCWDKHPSPGRYNGWGLAFPLPCPTGEAAVGLIGRSGAYVDAIGVECAPKPSLQDNIATAFRSWLRTNGITNASLVVMQNGQMIGKLGFGSRTSSTVVPIASLTKAITAMCIANLVDAGKLSYTDKVADRLSSFFKSITLPHTDANNMTIEHLLRHTSGMRFDSVVPPWATGITNTASADEMFAKAVLAKDFIRVPGTGMSSYNNVNYALLGMIIKQVTGQTYEAHCQQSVLTPHRFSNVRIGAGIPALGAFGGWEMSAEQYADFIYSHYRKMSASADAFMNNSLSRGPITSGVSGYGLGVSVWKNPKGGRNIWHFGSWPGGGTPAPPTTPAMFGSYFAFWDNELVVVATYDKPTNNSQQDALDDALAKAAGKR
jgi:CubicO group peptidase (beta-lactamase class C family)